MISIDFHSAKARQDEFLREADEIHRRATVSGQRKGIIKVVVAIMLVIILLAVIGGIGRETAVHAAPTISEESAIAAAIPGEIDPNDFRITEMGGVDRHNASTPAVAYNSDHNQYLVVWSLANEASPEDTEIFGARINAATGTRIGDPFQISNMTGPNGAYYVAYAPDVAYNSTAQEYMVVWSGDEASATQVDEEFEIFGRRVMADGTTPAAEFRISNMGPDADDRWDAMRPAIAYNSYRDCYLVIWTGSDNHYEREIYGQLLGPTGSQRGNDDFRISDMGPDGDNTFYVSFADITYNSQTDEYLVVWSGEDDTAPLQNGKIEIFGQRLKHALIAPSVISQSGANDFRISQTGTSTNRQSHSPVVTYNSQDNEFLVVWSSDGPETGPLAQNEYEIFGQRLNEFGEEIGSNDFRISQLGPDGSSYFDAYTPEAIYNPAANEYLVTWYGHSHPDTHDHQTFAQRLRADGSETGENDFPVNEISPNHAAMTRHQYPVLAFSGSANTYLVIWEGEKPGHTNPGEEAIIGQQLNVDGSKIGEDNFLINDIWQDRFYKAYPGDIAYNSQENEYLVAWIGTEYDSTGRYYDIFVQRIDANTGQRLGPQKNISDSKLRSLDFSMPVLQYNPDRNEYLIAWGHWGVNMNGQILDAQGSPITHAHITITDDGVSLKQPALAYNNVNKEYLLVHVLPDHQTDNGVVVSTRINTSSASLIDVHVISDDQQNALEVDAAYNSQNNQYLVVWNTRTDSGYEIAGQQILGATGNEAGLNDFLISDMGSDSNPEYSAYSPGIIYNPDKHEYLVVWSGSDDRPPLLPGEREIYGQRLDALTAVPVGEDDFRISDVGVVGDPSFKAERPQVAYSPQSKTYLVVWDGSDAPLPHDEIDIFGQLLDEQGQEIGDDDVRLSDMGPDGNTSFFGQYPAIGHNSQTNQFLITWYGQDDTGLLHSGESEIFGQFFALEEMSPAYVYQVFLPAILK